MYPINSVYYAGKIQFYDKKDKDNPKYNFDIFKTQVIQTKIIYSFLDFNLELYAEIEDSLEIFKKPILSKFLGYYSLDFGPNSYKIGNYSNLKIYRYGIKENKRAYFYAAPEIFVDGMLDNTKIAFKKGTLIKKVVEDLFKKIELDYGVIMDKCYDNLKLEWDIYYYGNVIDFIKNTILPLLDPFGAVFVGGKKIAFLPLIFTENELIKIFTKNLKAEDRATTQTDYVSSIWSYYIEGESIFDSLNFEKYIKIDVLKGTSKQENFPNEKFYVAAPYYSVLNGKNKPFAATDIQLKRFIYNVFLKKYKLNTVVCINELQPYLFPCSPVRIYPVLSTQENLKGEISLEVLDYFYRGIGTISTVEHIIKKNLSEGMKKEIKESNFKGVTKIEILKPGSFAGEKHNFKVASTDKESPIQTR